MLMTHEEVLEDIKTHPERHRHTFKELYECCVIGGILRADLMEAHEFYAPVGRNGGRNCDVIEGACSCGGWH